MKNNTQSNWKVLAAIVTVVAAGFFVGYGLVSLFV
jgi:hypothetical protein